MKEMKKLFLVIIGTICGVYANAYDFKDGKIYYKITDKNNKTVAVTSGDTKYDGNISIPEETSYDGVKYSVKSIEMLAFGKCDQLRKVEIPNSVTEMGDEVFLYCIGLESVVIGNGVKEIPWLSFSGCTNLKSVVLGSNVETIGDNAFKECTSLTDINIEDHVVTICPGAFLNCTALSSVTIGRSMREIGGSAFKSCTGLTKLIIHEGVEKIGMEAFSGCSQLQKVEIPNSVTKMDIEVFMYCTGLESVVIGNGVKEIPSHTFTGCKALKDVTIGSGVEAITVFSFKECVNIKSVTSLIQNPCTFESSAFPSNVYDDATLYVPKGTVGKYQSTDSWKKFYNIKEIGGTSDDIIVFADPEVKRRCVECWDTNGDGELSKTEAAAVKNLFLVFITNHKIESFDELQFFTGLTDIYGDAFFDCFNLKSIIIPGNVKSIGGGAFYDCSALHSLVIGNGVERIGEEAFYANSLSDINIPNSVMWIERMALTVSPWYYNQPEGLVYAGKVLYHYKGTMPDNTQIKIKEGTLGIAQGAFDGCSGLTSFTIPNSVTAIGEKAFRGTAWYNNQPEGLVYAGKVLYEYKGTMPESSIIDIKEGTLGIAELAFEDCEGLFSVIIPNSIECIGKRAFYNCSHLTTIISHIQDPFELDPISFCYLDEKSRVWSSFTDATLYVPVGTKAKYEATEGWKEFKNIVEGEPGPSAIQSPTFMKTINIYSISGYKVRSNATSLEGLPKGIYIVNGKKVIK